MQLQDRSGGTIEQLAGYVKQLTEAAAKRPEIGRVSTTFNPATPQVKVELDREKARTLGVPVDSVFSTLQTYLSGLYVNDFVRFGRVYKVFLQAEPQFTSKPNDIGQFYVRNNSGQMVPLNTLVNISKMSGPNLVTRFNLYNAAEIIGAPAPGYSSGQAIKAIEEVMKTMPTETGYEWSGLTLQEKKSEGQAPIIFGMAVLFVFLLLAAQYESWGLPFAVLLATPTVILGTMIGMLVRHFDLNVYAQIGLVMLIGLSAKNAILIVEFAKMRREEGSEILDAAVEGSRLRLRPILMTSFAFILGCVPLMLASGSGAASRSTMGTGVVFGMTIATAVGLFLIPVCYVFVQRIVERGGKHKPAGRHCALTRTGRSARMKSGPRIETISPLTLLRPCAAVIGVVPVQLRRGPGLQAPRRGYARLLIAARHRTTMRLPSTNSFGDLGWWDVYQDPQLNGLHQRGVDQQLGHQDRRRARACRRKPPLQIVRSQFFPSINAGGDLVTSRTSQKGPIPHSAGIKPQREYGDVFLSMAGYEVDLWGHIRRANEAARAQLLQRSEAQQTRAPDVGRAGGHDLSRVAGQLDLELRNRPLAHLLSPHQFPRADRNRARKAAWPRCRTFTRRKILVSTAEASIVNTLRRIEQTGKPIEHSAGPQSRSRPARQFPGWLTPFAHQRAARFAVGTCWSVAPTFAPRNRQWSRPTPTSARPKPPSFRS